MIKNYLSHFLPVLLALDLIIPFLLAPFYKYYNHLTQVMSVLGNSKAPLHSIYNIWLVAFGVAILISTLQLYPTVAQVSSSISNFIVSGTSCINAIQHLQLNSTIPFLINIFFPLILIPFSAIYTVFNISHHAVMKKNIDRYTNESTDASNEINR